MFRVCAAILIPLLGFGALELGLRVAGYGYPTSFFVRAEIGDKGYYITNDRFGFRFFPPTLARTPVPLRMAVDKPANRRRIFLFGESAAQGDPDPTFGVGRYLEVLLRERYPGTEFEVVCAAMTAINSHAILPIARECAGHDGDLWIIYMGNNEMVGPFGAGTIFGPQAPANSLVRANLALKGTRTGQLIEAMLRRTRHGGGAPKAWGGLSMFRDHLVAFDAPSRVRAYRNFQGNLEDILRAGGNAHVPIILSTVACNLKDCAPFASVPGKFLKDNQKTTWDQSFRKGVARETNGAWSDALQSFAKAAELDAGYAELQFRMGTCELALTNTTAAAVDFQRARDYDALGFRADSTINRIIRDTAGKAGVGVHLVDAADILGRESPDGIPGNEFFYEHVHLNFEGNYRLARAFADQVAKLLPAADTARATAAWADADVCNRRLAVSPWDRSRLWQENFSRVSEPPFTEQINDAARARMYMARISELNGSLNSAARDEARTMYDAAVALSPTDPALHGNYAQFLDQTGDLRHAVEQEQRVCELLPQFPEPAFRAGQLLARAEKPDEAREYFSRALALRDDYVPAMNELGLILANEQKPAEAAAQFARAIQVNPGYMESYLNLGFLAEREGKMTEAMAHYREAAELQPEGPAGYFSHAVALAVDHRRAEAIELFRAAVWMNPSFWQARYLLGVELAGQEKVEDARAQFSEVVRLRPDFARGHLNLGVAWAKQNKMAEAEAEFRTALRLDPTNKLAQQHLDTLQVWKDRHK